jgi:spore maturation protein CgeB
VKIAFFVHSLASDWNNGNAHFTRGVVRELLGLGHDVRVYEPAAGWSRASLVAEHGHSALADFQQACPGLETILYDETTDDAEALVDDADAVVVHEWNPPALIGTIGRCGVPALFHDTHHRSVTAPEQMRRYDLSGYVGVLAFGQAVADVYRAEGWHDRVFTWHEAADTALFRPLPVTPEADLTWVGNWGDNERACELYEFMLGPATRLQLRGTVFGVRYPHSALLELERSGLAFGGWLPNHRAPEVFARHRVTVHVPRRPYVELLPGIPTIRVFEALACGIPLVCSPWHDTENLFSPGSDFLVARDGAEMTVRLCEVLADPSLALSLRDQGRRTILERHTCRHRAEELLDILAAVGVDPAPAPLEEVA